MRTILISGANRGIGLKIAYKELHEGNRLSLGIRNIESINGSIIDPKKWPDKQIIVNKYDALDTQSTESWIANTVQQYGGFDTLVNCAGVFSKVPFLYQKLDEDEIEKTIRINFLSVWELCRLSWQNLVSSKKGRIITIVSMSGKRSKGNLAAYASSKFALMGLSQTIRNEGWEKGIRLSCRN